MKRLVVVESPTKARTIKNFLPGDFRVEASMGHVRDLPASASEIPKKYKKEDWSRLGVDVRNEFAPLYVVPSDKKKIVSSLKKAIKEADELYIATDEDREGESIGWHLVQVLKPKIPIRRMVFHEITREAIEEAIEHPREINANLVDAQEARRVLDRLVGYSISPLLWRKVAPKLSAGRVQGGAVRLLVMREKERIAFIPASYWDLEAKLDHAGAGFEAQLTHIDGVRLASGRDFDDETGRLKEDLAEGKDVLLLGEEKARSMAAQLPEEAWRVASVEQRTRSSSPYAPFITSTLQQEASRKLGFSASRTMRTAQKLYENGHITYMRTDSTNLSKQAITAARAAVKKRYGDDYLSAKPRRYSNKVRNAQEAHEAIRPAGSQMRPRGELRLSGDAGKLYDLIWKRTVAAQMADARQRFTSVQIEAEVDGETARFRASGKEILFPGFFRAYVEGSDDPEAEIEDRERPLPQLDEGDAPGCRGVEASGHETKPPARFTEASLIKILEQEGIGRPSTYASIIGTVERRGYVQKNGRQLVPTFTAFATNNVLEKQFEKLVDTGFTAEMEQVLDDIADGSKRAAPYLSQFYLSENGLEERVEKGMEALDARAISTVAFPQWEPYVTRVGKFGPYVEGELDGETVTASLPEGLFPGDVTPERLEEILKESNKGDVVLGMHPEEGMEVLLKSGPYGPYVQLGPDDQDGKPKRMSLPEGLQPEEVTFEVGLDLIALPRTLGEHPETGKPIKANIGRYGPYVQHGSIFASLKKEDDVLAVKLDRALELIKEKEAKKKPLRVLGEHPDGGEVEVWKGRYGPYVKHKRTNASLKDGQSIEKVTLEEGLELLAERRTKSKKKKGRKRKKK